MTESRKNRDETKAGRETGVDGERGGRNREKEKWGQGETEKSRNGGRESQVGKETETRRNRERWKRRQRETETRRKKDWRN